MAGILKVDQVQSDSNLSFQIAGANVAYMNATSLQMVGSNVSLAGTNVITNGKVVTSGMPVGAVVQVVTGSMSGSGTSTSSTYVDDGSLSITPLLSSSLIVVICQTSCSTAGDYSFFKLVESVGNTTVVLDVPWGNFSSSPQQLQGLNLTGYYTNASTSSKTFKLQGRNSTGGSGRTRYINYMTGANMILMEIAL